MGMTKKQASQKIEPLKREIEEIKKDLPNVKHPSSIFVLNQLIESREELLKMYEKHAGTPSSREVRS
ncbi:hypothetical protein CVD28_00570 [Bacillus sp. M6-12]|uniref:hypothetical protein n=1 Tax=Bacillus sp. M6-12 TaxID=2054166 RepID=UPI000C785637|nr:hypothetical protein [Bacillus sp. M6-12]PLS18928.1 hypothetical protein CVD28_00570 [Bacillus sp. M6-12]